MVMVDPSTVKLGKAPARIDSRTLRLAKYVKREALPSIPSSRDWGAQVSSWPMFGNDQYGDCVEAAAAHVIECLSANAQTEVNITVQNVLASYTAVTGFNPSDPNTDQGTVILDFLNWWRQTGYTDAQGQTHKIYAYVAVDLADVDLCKAAIDLFGNLYLGVLLPISAQGQTTWDVPPEGAIGNGAPGSWGGHCIPSFVYDTSSETKVVTWGTTLGMTWAFFAAYCDEAYAILTEEWFNQANQQAPSGFDLATLQQDLQEVTQSNPDPNPTPTPPTPPGPLPDDPIWQWAQIEVAYALNSQDETVRAQCAQNMLAGFNDWYPVAVPEPEPAAPPTDPGPPPPAPSN